MRKNKFFAVLFLSLCLMLSMQAIEAGIIHGNCIRCLRCVCQCPKSALHFQLHPILKRYLEQTPCEDTKVYL